MAKSFDIQGLHKKNSYYLNAEDAKTAFAHIQKDVALPPVLQGTEHLQGMIQIKYQKKMFDVEYIIQEQIPYISTGFGNDDKNRYCME